MIKTLINEIGRMKGVMLVMLMLLASFLEIFGLSLFVPVIEQIQGGGASQFTRYLSEIVHVLGLPPQLWAFLLLLSLLFLFKGGVTFWLRYVGAQMASDIQRRLRMRLFRSLLAARVDFVDGYRQGALLSTMGEHTNKAGQAAFLLVQMVAQWIAIISFAGFAMWISPGLTLITFVLGGVCVPLVRRIGLIAHRYGATFVHAQEEIQHHTLEMLQAKKFVNAMNLARPLERQFVEDNNGVFRSGRGVLFWSGSPGIIMQPISVVILSVVIWMSVRFGLSVAMLGVFALALIRLLPSLQLVLSMGADFRANSPSIMRVFDLLKAVEPAREPSGALAFEGIRNGIRIENVSFLYKSSEPVLRGLDMEIARGSMVALVGPSGSGKTTLADIILGLRKPTAGRVLVGGRDLAEMDMSQYRSRIAYVPQEAVLFHGTIRNNLLLGVEREVSQEELQHTCEMAGAWEFIEQRADGLDAIVGNRGMQLSGGQRQRLALARALLRNPELLVLDEATSALDQLSEQWIARTLDNLRASGNFTIVVIAHRYSTIQHADQIYEIRNGQASPLGRWEQAKSYLMREAQLLEMS